MWSSAQGLGVVVDTASVEVDAVDEVEEDACSSGKGGMATASLAGLIGAVLLPASRSGSSAAARTSARRFRVQIQQLTAQHTVSLQIWTAIHAWKSCGRGHAAEGVDWVWCGFKGDGRTVAKTSRTMSAATCGESAVGLSPQNSARTRLAEPDARFQHHDAEP